MAFGLPTSVGLDILAYYIFGAYLLGAPKEELPIEVTDVDGVHVNDMNVLEPGESKIGQNLTSESTCTNH